MGRGLQGGGRGFDKGPITVTIRFSGRSAAPSFNKLHQKRWTVTAEVVKALLCGIRGELMSCRARTSSPVRIGSRSSSIWVEIAADFKLTRYGARPMRSP